MKAAGNYDIRIYRRSRFPGQSDAIITLSGSKSGGAIDSGEPDAGPTFGASIGLATGFCSQDMGECFILDAELDLDGSTASNIRSYFATKYDVGYLSYDSDSALVYAGDYADTTHWDDSGHDKVGDVWWGLEQAVATERSITSGTVKVGCLGDSRVLGSGATSDATCARAILRTNAAAATYPHSQVGPVTDSLGFAHDGWSGYTTRSIGASLGHSQRDAHSHSIDAYVGSGKSYNDTKIWHIMLGVNDITGRAAGENEVFEYVDELVRMVVYMYDYQVSVGTTPGFTICTEPVNGVTTTGPAQRLIRVRNRAYHAAVAYCAGSALR